jgi:hypothetical protein
MKEKRIMETSRSCFPFVPAFIAVSMLSGCDRGPGLAANISYRQIGICKGFEAASGPVTSKADEAHAFFKIETVDNTKSNKAFTFDPRLLYVDQSNPDQKGWDVRPLYRRFASVDSRIPQSLGISLAPESTVPAGGKLDVNRSHGVWIAASSASRLGLSIHSIPGDDPCHSITIAKN